MRNETHEVLILGGGVIGLSIARELVIAGVRRIAIVDRGRLGGGASFAAAGMLAPNAECEEVDDFYRFCDRSRKMYPEFADELLAETGVDIELDRRGTLYTAFTDGDLQHISERFRLQTAAGIPVERLSRGETLRAEPGLAENVRESLYFPNDWQVENRKLLAALESFAALNGINVIENTRVDSLLVRKGQIRGAVAGSDGFSAETTVIATGAWTSLIKIGDVQMPIAVKPLRGQMIGFRMAERQLHHVIYSPRGYVVPRADGRVLAGATVEDAGFENHVTDEAVSALHAAAAELVPALGGAEIAESWSGLRPFAAGGMPVIGKLNGFEGAWVATAHYRNGILLAPITAKIIAEGIVRGTPSPYFETYGPDRSAKFGSVANA